MTSKDQPAAAAVIKILVVDDEKGILKSLQRELHALPYQFEFINSSEEAMAKLEHEFYHLVLTDNLMPKFTGAQLLERVRQLHPTTRRVMLTGKSERNGEMGIKDLSVMHAYMEKPWKKEEKEF